MTHGKSNFNIHNIALTWTATLVHSCVVLPAVTVQWQSSVAAAVAAWPTGPGVLTLQLLTEKICRLLV